MKRMCRVLAVFTLLLLLNGYSQFCVAQIGGPGDPPDDPAGDPDAPIDGGISLLIAAGVGYGLKKAHDKRKKTNTVHLLEKDNE